MRLGKRKEGKGARERKVQEKGRKGKECEGRKEGTNVARKTRKN